MTKEQHHQYRQSVGQLLWLRLVRPDLQHAARDLSKHLVAPTQLDLQQLKHCLRYVKGTQHYQLLLQPQLPAGFHLPLRSGQRIPLLIECFSDSDWAGDVDTRQSTSGSLVTILKNNMHSSSKTQQVIATSSAEAELYAAISSTVADAIHLKQLITEIENNIGRRHLRPRQASTKHCSFLRFIFCNKFGSKDGDQQANKTHSTSLFCGFRICIRVGIFFFVVFQQKPTQLMHSPNHWQLLLCNDICQQLAFKPMLPTKRGNTTTSSLSLTTSRRRTTTSNDKQLFANNCVHNKHFKLYN